MNLGIAHFGSLDIKQYLENAKPGGRLKFKGTLESKQLNFTHPHLLLVDDGNETAADETYFRLKLETFFYDAGN